jgi:GTPase
LPRSIPRPGGGTWGQANRATLEEATEADLLLHVVDASSPHASGQATVVVDELEQIGARAPIITVMNKIDLIPAELLSGVLADLFTTFPGAVAVSAITRAGLGDLRATVGAVLPRPAAVAVQQHM